METKTPEAYHALICGMVKHGQAVGAWEHYNQMLGINVKLINLKLILIVFVFFLIDSRWFPTGSNDL